MWEQAWLEYKSDDREALKYLFESIYLDEDLSKSPLLVNAVKEITVAAGNLFGCIPKMTAQSEGFKAGLYFILEESSNQTEAYTICEAQKVVYLKSTTEKGLLYAAFRFLEIVRTHQNITNLNISEVPSLKHRFLNHWDNLDGSIERGYSGDSFFFCENKIHIDQRTEDYARLLASIHINSVVINNVNVNAEGTLLITSKHLQDLKKLSELFYGYGIQLYISLNFAAPITLGGMDTCDPREEKVVQWWKHRLSIVFGTIPLLGGFLVKADSEGRPGPHTYGRSQAEGANMLAQLVEPYEGTIIWRCFVYNCQQDWRDEVTDRAKAGYETFKPLDGHFYNNVILQIKNGPMDFQVREPVSPLFGGLESTTQYLELQIAQEYTGQQRHICYLIPMWKEVLETVVRENKAVKEIICGIAAVSNTGNDENWTGHDFAAANLYGYGKLAWNTELSAEEILSNWTDMTYSSATIIEGTVRSIALNSWHTYEKYTSPLGIGWMVNPSHHYGPNIDGYEYDRWGTYHRANWEAIGVDRTASGTGYTLQYSDELQSMYENPETCPLELCLFFHRIKYTQILSNGKPLLQYLYDLHFEGVEEVKAMLTKWKSLKSEITSKQYQRTLQRLEIQLEHAELWRDTFNTYFYRKTGIMDVFNRKIYS